MKSVYVPFRFVSLATLALLTVVSCQKTDNAPSPPKTLNATSQAALMDAKIQDVLVSASNSAVGAGVASDADDEAASCRVITFTPSKDVLPAQKIIDYGSGCVGDDGITRSGKKIITFYADPDTSPVGTFISETRYDEFFVDDIKTTGFTRSYVETTGNQGLITQKNNIFKRLTSPDGTVQTWDGTHHSKQVRGYGTDTKDDNVFEITGSANGTEKTADGIAVRWVSQISNLHPEVRKVGCYDRVAGVINVVLEFTKGGDGRFLETFSYGHGTCDNEALLSINNGEWQDITLPLYFWPLSK